MKILTPLGENTVTACLEEFLAQREAEGCKPKTIYEYRLAIRDFIRESAPADVAQLTPKHAVAWSRLLSDRGMKSGGMNSKQRPVWTWFRWLYEHDYLPVDISTKVKKARPRDVTRRTASEDIKEALLLQVEQREMPRRNRALIHLLWSSALRCEEVTRLTIQDYDHIAGTLDVLGKGDKRRTVVVDAAARAAMLGYINQERGKGPGPLFYGRGKAGDPARRPLTRRGVQHLFATLGKRAGVEVSPHDFRRACASNMLAAGVGFDSVMYQLGHTTPTMTMTYGQLGRAKRAQAEIQRFHRTG